MISTYNKLQPLLMLQERGRLFSHYWQTIGTFESWVFYCTFITKKVLKKF